MIPWTEEERRLIESLAVDACSAVNCDIGALYIKLLVADRAWCAYGQGVNLQMLKDMDLRDMVKDEAWKGSEIMEQRVDELVAIVGRRKCAAVKPFAL